MEPVRNISHIPDKGYLIRATRALIQFCADHGDQRSYVHSIKTCAEALERKDYEGAIRIFKGIPTGGMGGFDDWIPSAATPNESDDYAWAIFDALSAFWKIHMRLLETQLAK